MCCLFMFSSCAVQPLANKLEAYLIAKLEPLVKEEIEKKLLHEAVKLGVEKYLPYFDKHPVLKGDILGTVDAIADAYVFHEMPSIGVAFDRITQATEDNVSAMFTGIADKFRGKKPEISVKRKPSV